MAERPRETECLELAEVLQGLEWLAQREHNIKGGFENTSNAEWKRIAKRRLLYLEEGHVLFMSI